MKLSILSSSACAVLYLLALKGISTPFFYLWCTLLGAAAGDWAVICTMTSEQFGTNLRATVTTAVPNFIRFSLVPMNLAVLALKSEIGLVYSAFIVGTVVLSVAYFSVLGLEEPYGRDLNFVETE
jgi:hypothetical protein